LPRDGRPDIGFAVDTLSLLRVRSRVGFCTVVAFSRWIVGRTESGHRLDRRQKHPRLVLARIVITRDNTSDQYESSKRIIQGTLADKYTPYTKMRSSSANRELEAPFAYDPSYRTVHGARQLECTCGRLEANKYLVIKIQTSNSFQSTQREAIWAHTRYYHK
jgi:hypothetical protein